MLTMLLISQREQAQASTRGPREQKVSSKGYTSDLRGCVESST